ncbi:MAG: glycosyltransferase family 4 protein [Isosphaeraceae bacterium]|nr:glycosyltransferase family 4 protein [Isosphaeraceae bacterium]
MKALALVDAPDHVCCRYRLRAFEPALRAAGWTLTPQALARRAFGRLAQFARAADFDIVILQRKLLPRWQFALLRRSARRLAFDFDDAVLYRDSYDPRGPHSRRRLGRFGQTVRGADTVIAGNDFLADCALRAGARPERVQVIPTCIETTRYQPNPRPEGATGLELVWIGSSSTLQGLEQQRALWERVGREVPGVRLRVICDRFPSFDGLPVVAVPWSEATEAADLAAGDVGISWVPDDLWSRGKCGLKVLQYQAAGLPVIANPVGVHPEMIEPGASGFLPKTDDDWVDAVRALAIDPSLRARLRTAARASVDAYYSVAAWSSAFVTALAEPGSRIPSPRSRPFGHARPPGRPGRRPHLGMKRASLPFAHDSSDQKHKHWEGRAE